jgi:hypothetical protein
MQFHAPKADLKSRAGGILPQRCCMLGPKVIDVSDEEFEQLVSLRRRWRPDCEVAFGTNGNEDIWAWVTYGKHRKPEKVSINDPPLLLRQIVGLFVEMSWDTKRIPGGRIFIDQRRAFFKDDESIVHEIAVWKSVIRRNLSSANDVAIPGSINSPSTLNLDASIHIQAEGMTEYQRMCMRVAQNRAEKRAGNMTRKAQ